MLSSLSRTESNTCWHSSHVHTLSAPCNAVNAANTAVSRLTSIGMSAGWGVHPAVGLGRALEGSAGGGRPGRAGERALLDVMMSQDASQ